MSGAGGATGRRAARPWDVERRAALLAGVPPFAPLPPATIREVAALCRPRAMRRGDFIFREGEPASVVHLAAEGRVKIVRETAAGRQVVLARALDAGTVLQLPAREFIRKEWQHYLSVNAAYFDNRRGK